MALLPPRRLDEVTTALRTRANRLFSTMTLTLTPAEFIDAYILPEHIEPLEKVRELVGQVGGWYSSSVIRTDDGMMPVTINFVGQAPIILPQYIASGVRAGASESVISKIQAWAAERLRYGNLFGDAIDGLRWLNEYAPDLRAMRTMFPALPILLKDLAQDDKSPAAKMALRLDSNKGVVNLPRLPREVAARLLEASQLITSTTLFESATFDEKHAAGTATYTRDTSAGVKRDNIFYPGSGIIGSFV